MSVWSSRCPTLQHQSLFREKWHTKIFFHSRPLELHCAHAYLAILQDSFWPLTERFDAPVCLSFGGLNREPIDKIPRLLRGLPRVSAWPAGDSPAPAVPLLYQPLAGQAPKPRLPGGRVSRKVQESGSALSPAAVSAANTLPGSHAGRGDHEPKCHFK